MDIELVTGLDLPSGEHVWQVGDHHYVRTRTVRVGDDPDKAAIMVSIKIQAWCCDEHGEPILDDEGHRKALITKTKGMMKDKIADETIAVSEEITDLTTDAIARCRANCVVYDGLFASLPVEGGEVEEEDAE